MSSNLVETYTPYSFEYSLGEKVGVRVHCTADYGPINDLSSYFLCERDYVTFLYRGESSIRFKYFDTIYEVEPIVKSALNMLLLDLVVKGYNLGYSPVYLAKTEENAVVFFVVEEGNLVESTVFDINKDIIDQMAISQDTTENEKHIIAKHYSFFYRKSNIGQKIYFDYLMKKYSSFEEALFVSVPLWEELT